MYTCTSSTRTRRGGSCLRDILKTCFIYRICMRRAPARTLRACFVRSCCTDVVQEHDLRTAPAQCNAKQTPSSHFTLRSSHFTLALHTPSTLHLISDHVNSSHLISPHLTSSQLFSSHPISSHMSSKKVLLNCFHLIRALINLSHLLDVVLNSSQLFCMPENSYCQHTEAWDTDALTLYTGKASRKFLCTTKLSSTHLGKTVKHTVSCSGFLPNTSPMQHSCSHYNAFCSTTYTSMQPLHCDLHPLEQTERRNQLTSKRSKPHPPHTGGTLHRRLQPLYTEKHTVSCSGFLPNTSPMQHSCSHYNAFCSTTYTSMQPLQCDVAEQRGGTDWPRNDPNRTRRTQEVPFIAGCNHFTRKNTWFRAPASSPKPAPCNIHAARTMRFAVSHHPLLNVFLCDVSLTPPFMSVFLCDVKPHTTLHWVYCYVMSSLTPPFIGCIVMWCKVSHHPSVSVLLCDVKSHTTLHWVYCCVM